MARYFLFILALVALGSSCFTAGAPPAMPHQQLMNIIDALIGAGDFTDWGKALSGSDLFTIPLSSTLFVPSDDLEGASAAAADRSIVPYHIVPQRLTFSELSLLKPHSRLPTLLPNRTILVTNTSASNFTLDATRLSHPDLYLTSTVAVHGVAALLDYRRYGSAHHASSPPPPPSPSPPSPAKSEPEPSPPLFVPVGGEMSGSCLCDYSAIVFLVLCGALILKILGK